MSEFLRSQASEGTISQERVEVDSCYGKRLSRVMCASSLRVTVSNCVQSQIRYILRIFMEYERRPHQGNAGLKRAALGRFVK